MLKYAYKEELVHKSPRVTSPIQQEFKRLVSAYRRDADLSPARSMATHPAYQAIIALGKPVVPLLLEELKQNPDSWFVALSLITKAKPEKHSDFPDPQKRAEAWLRWGRKWGYIR